MLTDVETRYGTLAAADTETDIIGRFLARYGEWAWDEVRFVASTLPGEGARVLEAGAFLGGFALGIALQRRLGFLCLVEANSAHAPLLARNIRRNCPAPAAVVEALIGWPGVDVANGRCEDENLGSLAFCDELGEQSGGGDIAKPRRVVTLSELRAEHGAFDLVKLDVEGMELGILRGDAEHLARGGTSIWVECREDARSLAVAELLLSWGLDVHYFASPAFNPDNPHGSSSPISPFAYEAGLLAAPQEPPALDDELRAHGCILRPVRHVDDVKDALWRTPRWGAPKWIDAGVAEVAALAGRQLRGESYETFLGPEWHPQDVPSEGLRNQLAATEDGLWNAEALAFDRLGLLQIVEERANVAEERLARASALALDRLAELGFMRERAAVTEARLAFVEDHAAALEERALAAERRAIAIETSRTWRLTTALRQFVTARPRLHSALRRGLGAVASATVRRR